MRKGLRLRSAAIVVLILSLFMFGLPASPVQAQSMVLSPTSGTAGTSVTVTYSGMSAYIASKHAAMGLMRSAAMDGAPNNIRVNTVNPSPIDTPMMASLERMHGVSDRNDRPLANTTPLGRYGEPEEVARMMLFLASDDSSFCTGGVYMVDGGVSAGRR